MAVVAKTEQKYVGTHKTSIHAMEKKSRRSRQDFLSNPTIHVRKSKVSSSVSVGEPLMIKAKQVQKRGVQIMIIHASFHGSLASLVCASKRKTSFDSSSRHPNRESVRIVIAAIPLHVSDSTSKFTTP